MTHVRKLYVSGRPYFGINTGISRYARIYLDVISDWCSSKDVEFIGVFQKDPSLAIPRNMRVVVAHQFFRKLPPTLFERFIAPIYYKLGGASLVINFSGLGVPWWIRDRAVSVFYDLVVELCPETMSSGTRLLFKIFWRKDFLKATHRVVISSSLMSRVLKEDNDNAENTVVIRCPFGMNYEKAIKLFIEEKSKNNSVDHDQKYFLAIGSIEPRKRYEVLVSNFLMYKKKTKSNVRLKICGGASWGEKDLSYLNSEHVDLIQNVSDHELVKLYANCAALVSAELYSGYGTPLYEARLFGIPILINAVPEFKEAAGSSAIVTDYNDPKDVIAKLNTLLEIPHSQPEMNDINLIQGKENLYYLLERVRSDHE